MGFNNNLPKKMERKKKSNMTYPILKNKNYTRLLCSTFLASQNLVRIIFKIKIFMSLNKVNDQKNLKKKNGTNKS